MSLQHVNLFILSVQRKRYLDTKYNCTTYDVQCTTYKLRTLYVSTTYHVHYVRGTVQPAFMYVYYT